MSELRQFMERLAAEIDRPGYYGMRDAIRTVLAATAPDAQPAAERWHGPFTWQGGECPLPLRTWVKAKLRSGESGEICAEDMAWWHGGGLGDIVEFSYLSPDGWLKLPPGWVPPGSAVPFVGKGVDSKRYWIQLPSDYANFKHVHFTHIRLLLRPAKSEPEPWPEWAYEEGGEFCVEDGKRVVWLSSDAIARVAELHAIIREREGGRS